MLVAQMPYRNPLSPAEEGQFAPELAQFSSLEGLQKISGCLDSSFEGNLPLAMSINNSMATMLIAKTVRAKNDTLELAETEDARIQFLSTSPWCTQPPRDIWATKSPGKSSHGRSLSTWPLLPCSSFRSRPGCPPCGFTPINCRWEPSRRCSKALSRKDCPSVTFLQLGDPGRPCS